MYCTFALLVIPVQEDAITNCIEALYSVLTSMFDAGGKWQQAREIFEQMKQARFKPDVSSYTALLAAYHPANKWRQALQVCLLLSNCDVLFLLCRTGHAALGRAVLCCAAGLALCCVNVLHVSVCWPLLGRVPLGCGEYAL